MLDALMVSQAVLLLLVVLLALALLATIRQLGVLYERIAPLGALTLPHTLGPGEEAPVLAVTPLVGPAITLGGIRSDSRGQLILFISPECPMCKRVLQWMRSFARAESSRVDVVLVGDGAAPAHATLLEQHGLGHLPLVLDPTVGVRYQVGKLPYGILIDGTGTVRAAGVVNSREHLESLLVAFEKGVASLQEYLRAAGQSVAPSGGPPSAKPWPPHLA